MMAYDRIVTELKTARLRGTSFHIVHSLIEASLAVASGVRSSPLSPNIHLFFPLSHELFIGILGVIVWTQFTFLVVESDVRGWTDLVVD